MLLFFMTIVGIMLIIISIFIITIKCCPLEIEAAQSETRRLLTSPPLDHHHSSLPSDEDADGSLSDTERIKSIFNGKLVLCEEYK